MKILALSLVLALTAAGCGLLQPSETETVYVDGDNKDATGKDKKPEEDEVVSADPAEALLIESLDVVVLGSCNRFLLKGVDGKGVVAIAESEIKVTFGDLEKYMYGDDACNDRIYSAAIPAGKKSTIFYVKLHTLDNVQVNPVSVMQLAAFTVKSIPGEAYKIKMVMQSVTSASTCSDAPVVLNTTDCYEASLSFLDARGYATLVSKPILVGLESQSGVGNFYSASDCLSVISNLQFLNGDGVKKVYYKINSISPHNVRAVHPSGSVGTSCLKAN